jgi:hypothetical protein
VNLTFTATITLTSLTNERTNSVVSVCEQTTKISKTIFHSTYLPPGLQGTWLNMVHVFRSSHPKHLKNNYTTTVAYIFNTFFLVFGISSRSNSASIKQHFLKYFANSSTTLIWDTLDAEYITNNLGCLISENRVNNVDSKDFWWWHTALKN